MLRDEGCIGCEGENWEGPVGGQGPLGAKLAFIAESPGEVELTWCRICWKPGDEIEILRDANGEPTLGQTCREKGHPLGATLVGPTGRITRGLAHGAGIRTREVYFTNIVKCRPPHDGEIPSAVTERCSRFLRRELEVVRP